MTGLSSLSSSIFPSFGISNGALGLGQNVTGSFGDPVAGLFTFGNFNSQPSVDVFSLAFGTNSPSSSSNLFSQVFNSSGGASTANSGIDITKILMTLIDRLDSSSTPAAKPAASASQPAAAETKPKAPDAKPADSALSKPQEFTIRKKTVTQLPESSIAKSEPKTVQNYAAGKDADMKKTLDNLAKPYKQMGLNDEKAQNAARTLFIENRAREIATGKPIRNTDADIKANSELTLDVKKPGDMFAIVSASYLSAGGKFNLEKLKNLLNNSGNQRLVKEGVGTDETATLAAVQQAIEDETLKLTQVYSGPNDKTYLQGDDAADLFDKSIKYVNDRHFGNDVHKLQKGTKDNDLTLLASISEGPKDTSFPPVRPIEITIEERVPVAPPKPVDPPPPPPAPEPEEEEEDDLLSMILPFLLMSQFFGGGQTGSADLFGGGGAGMAGLAGLFGQQQQDDPLASLMSLLG